MIFVIDTDMRHRLDNGGITTTIILHTLSSTTITMVTGIGMGTEGTIGAITIAMRSTPLSVAPSY